ncbi:MAG: DUF4129 domain-containing protein [Treponema sp.]|jgi:hypothetical protein|nr:DUF4129 domain-containing protein [Treponema sp.]
MLNSGILALRRRSLWEAADSGLLLWRRNLGYLIPFFALPFWICAFALLSFSLSKTAPPSGSFGNFPLLRAWFILWWLNPLFDRFILHVVAARYFEPHSSFPGLFRGLAGSICRGLPGDLLWRRFSPWRAAVMPLRVLERAAVRSRRTGKRQRVVNRKRALSGGGLHFCIFLTVWCPLLQWILIAGETFFVFLISQQFNLTLPGSGNPFALGGLYYYTLWCVNYLVVESLYVCMGFGLYLNSRVEVEGWDIELLFRQFAGRRRKAGFPALLLFALILILPHPPGIFAQSPVPDSVPGTGLLLPPVVGESMPAESLQEILQSDMGGERKVWSIRSKDQDEDTGRNSFISRFSSPLASFPWLIFFRVLLILALAALALSCGIYVYRRRRLALAAKPPESLVSPQIPAPELLLEEAGRVYRRGLVREAWALCYRASLEALARYRLIRFPPGATEYRCLALVRHHQGGRDPGGVDSFAALIRHWVALAYGGVEPPGGAFEEALAWAGSLNRPGAVHD